MDRRQFLQASLGAAITGPLLAERAAAQPPPAPSRAADILRGNKPAPITRQLVLDAHSRSLHWIVSADEVAEAAIEMVCGGSASHRSGLSGPHRSRQGWRRNCLRSSSACAATGLHVTQIEGPAIKDVTEPHAERIIAAAAQAGCTHYSFGGYAYDFTKADRPQLDAIKLRLEKFVRLNQKHKIALIDDTAPGPASVGGVVLDLLPLMKSFDPKFIGFQMTGHTPGSIGMVVPVRYQGRNHPILLLTAGSHVPNRESFVGGYEHIWDEAIKMKVESVMQAHPNTNMNILARTKYVHDNYPPAKNPLLYGAERTARYLNIVRACTQARLEIFGW